MTKLRRFSLVGKKSSLFLTILILPIALIFNIIVVTLLLLNPRSWKFNKAEASAILKKELIPFRSMSFEECKKFVEADPALATTVTGESGTEYQVEVQMIWDRCFDGPIKVLGSVDDGRLRAFKPLSQSFIIERNSAGAV